MPSNESQPRAKRRRVADWELPPGVNRPLWDYMSEAHIARDYDATFAETNLIKLDRDFLTRHFRAPGRLVDLGCGTGRLLTHFSQRGLETLGVDLSEEMLAVCREKREELGAPIGLLKANLCDLEVLRDGSFAYACCMFSTMGMIIGREQRRRFLAEVRRVLKPSGLFGLHVHNRWYNLSDRQGRGWFARDLVKRVLRRHDTGDKVMKNYRGIPGLTLHLFTATELRAELGRAGFDIVDWVPLTSSRRESFPAGTLLRDLRANGWLVMTRRSSR
ncbi:dTDP-3-amino-3,4,6-trideoxy-alpha-D-glucopyranose [Planctomycetes bacterium Pan216]|uniref:dTDP-3-amino-3,4, 6-trideoxy-alpha-D-glucopyranose n=1 Tax=Kolteria novifilia TaxID=2527975 RepID=A0A518BAR8_9BACT|nr:dTDP-3-amino-3,4,6-trideoxy-alpha-D-glucopyranose [Planctomycetes bacterium Pan216]